MAIDVTVTEQCDRCKRKEQITIGSDKIEEFEKRHEARAAQMVVVQNFVQAQNGALPDLVVIFKGKVQMLNQICDAHCASTVQNNVDALFREYQTRKPRTPKDKSTEDAAEPKTPKGKKKDNGVVASAE